MIEAKLEARFRKGVREAGGIVVKLAPTVRGVPDRMVLWHGRVDLVELKTVTGRLSAIQRVWHADAASVGVRVSVLHGPEEIDQWIKENR